MNDNPWKDQNGEWRNPDGIHFMRQDFYDIDKFEYHTYRKDGEVVSHTDCPCTNK